MSASLTRAQALALSLDRNLSVTAGAGTGKTRVLTERFLKILEEAQHAGALGERGGAHPKRIVAVTFTRKAANEMRERVTKAISKKVKEAIEGQDAHGFRFWVQVRRDMDEATITTIHGLAARVVRMAALELKVDPKFRVVEGIDARLLLEEAVSMVLADPPDEALGALRELYLLRGGKGVRDLLRALVGDRVHAEVWAGFLVGHTPDAVLDALWRAFVPVDEAESKRLAIRIAKVRTELLKDGAAVKTPPPAGSKAAVFLEALAECAHTAEGDHRTRTTAISRLFALCTTQKGEYYKRPHDCLGKAADWNEMGCQGLDKDLFAAMEPIVRPWAGTLTGVPGEADERMVVLLRGVARLLLAVTGRYDDAKTRRGVLDYHDLEGYARRALRSPGVAEAIRRRIRYLLVDEFQDTNEDQWAILRALAVAPETLEEEMDATGTPVVPEQGAWASVDERLEQEQAGPIRASATLQATAPGTPKDPDHQGPMALTDLPGEMDLDNQPLGVDRLFIVGDAKQSIYAFRGADVAVYQQSRRTVQAANEHHGLDAEPLEVPQTDENQPVDEDRWVKEQRGEVALDCNFRSLPAVVAFTNRFFDRLFAPKDPQRPEPFEAEPGALVGHRSRLELGPHEGSVWAEGGVRLLLTPRGFDEAVANGDCSRSDADRLGPTRYQFLRMVQDIRQRAGPEAHPEERLVVADSKSDAQGVSKGRPARYHDVAILLPRKRNLRILEEVLRDQGVPYVVVGGRGFWSKQEVWDAVNLLGVVADPRRDVELLGVLRSPFFAWNDEALAWLAGIDGASLWQRLVKLRKGEVDGDPPGSFLGLAPAQVVEEIQRWRSLARTAGAARLLMDLLERTGYLASLRAREPESAARLGVQNLEKLVSLVRELEARRGRSIGPLVRDLLSLADQDAEEAEAQLPGEEETGVRVMTVHAAKGLQFPVVYVAETNAELQTGAFQEAGGVVYDRLDDQPFYALKARAADGEVEGSFTYDALRKRALPREQAEQKRLLYVAATRAEDHLVLVGSSKRLGPPDGRKAPALQSFEHGRSWLDWLEYALGLDQAMHLELLEEPERERWFELQDAERHETARVLVDVKAPRVQRAPGPADQDRVLSSGKESVREKDRVVQVVPAPVFEHRPVVRISPSQLSLYAACKARFRYGVLEGMSEGWVRGVKGGAPDYGATMGSLLHRALAAGATKEEPVPHAVRKRAEAMARRYAPNGWPSKEVALDHLEQHASRAIAALASQLGTHAVLLETDLDAEVVTGLRLAGRLDRVHRDPDGRLVVVDLKTDEVGSSEDQVAKEHGHDAQVLLYDAALRKAGFETAPAGLLYSATGRLLRVAPPDEGPSIVAELGRRVQAWHEHQAAAGETTGEPVRASDSGDRDADPDGDEDPVARFWPRDAKSAKVCRGCGFWQGNRGPCPGIAPA